MRGDKEGTWGARAKDGGASRAKRIRVGAAAGEAGSEHAAPSEWSHGGHEREKEREREGEMNE